MGWFEVDSDITLGDIPLDEAAHFIRRVGDEYREAVGRPPTIMELERTLQVVLSGFDDETVEGLSSLEVTKVTIKGKKRPKKQAWEPGDLFVVPLPNDLFAFGRVVWRRQPKKGAAVVEIFRHCSKVPVFASTTTAKGRLVQPTRTNGILAFEDRRWLIVGQTPGYRADDHDDLRMYMDFGKKADLFTVEFECVARKIPIQDLPEGATDMNLYDEPDKLEKHILEELEREGIAAD